jgi:hypothetical protein
MPLRVFVASFSVSLCAAGVPVVQILVSLRTPFAFLPAFVSLWQILRLPPCLRVPVVQNK